MNRRRFWMSLDAKMTIGMVVGFLLFGLLQTVWFTYIRRPAGIKHMAYSDILLADRDITAEVFRSGGLKMPEDWWALSTIKGDRWVSVRVRSSSPVGGFAPRKTAALDGQSIRDKVTISCGFPPNHSAKAFQRQWKSGVCQFTLAEIEMYGRYYTVLERTSSGSR